MTRLWAGGVLIEVQPDPNHMPLQFIWEGHHYPIQDIANHWRVDVGWWRLHIQRDYFKVSSSNGLLVILYHDLLTDCWYLQRVYD